MTDRSYCCEVAQETESSQAGSAIQVDVWLLLEYAYAWKAKALEENILPPSVNALLAALSAQFAERGLKLRVQFIKQSASELHTPRLYFADSRDGQWRLRTTRLQGYDSLPRLSAERLLDGSVPNLVDSDERLCLVCTNGQRDICCARFGRPLYSQLHAAFGDQVWQTTHVGGHRYAPNLLCLPSGFMYGGVSPEVGVDVVATHERGELDLDRLRGRCHYPPLVQAGEIFARRHLGLRQQRALTCHQAAPGNSVIRYEGEATGELGLVSRTIDNVASACEPKPKPSVVYSPG